MDYADVYPVGLGPAMLNFHRPDPGDVERPRRRLHLS